MICHVIQVLGGGKCLVTFTPEQAITHEIEVTFNNDQVSRDQEGKYDRVRMEISAGAGISVPLPRAGRGLRQRGRGGLQRGRPRHGGARAPRQHRRGPAGGVHHPGPRGECLWFIFHLRDIFCLDLFSTFTQGADAELAVSVQGPVEDIPVKVNI